MSSLQEQITSLNESLSQQLPQEVLQVFDQSIRDLKSSNLETHALQVGDSFPDFSLLNSQDRLVELKELTKKGKVIIAFFRDAWCPYCSLELRALQNHLKNIAAANTTLIAISPQRSQISATMQQELDLDFEILIDADNLLARKVGISFKLQDYVLPVYASLGINLTEYNGNVELPMPAVYLLDTDLRIQYAFVDSNYTNRVDIEELIAKL